MTVDRVYFLFALAPPAQPGTTPDPTGQLLQMLGTFAILGIMFYFILIRPQSQQRKRQDEMLKTIRPGDKVLTSGGLIATVVSVKDKTVTIRSADSKLEILKSAVSEVTEKSSSTES